MESHLNCLILENNLEVHSLLKYSNFRKICYFQMLFVLIEPAELQKLGREEIPKGKNKVKKVYFLSLGSI